MINFRKVFTIKTFSLSVCVLLLYETAAFAEPVLNILRVPIGEKATYTRVKDGLASNETVKVTGDFIPQKITDKFGNTYYIEKVDPADCRRFAKEFLKIYWEETGSPRDTENINSTFSIAIFHKLYADLTENSEYKTIMALFLLKDENNAIIGSRLFYKPKVVLGVESEIVTGMDVIRFKYQNRRLGTQLRRIAFGWLKEKGYDRYAIRISHKNERSMESLKRVASELNAAVSATIDPELYILELPDTAAEKQAISMPSSALEAINSSL